MINGKKCISLNKKLAFDYFFFLPHLLGGNKGPFFTTIPDWNFPKSPSLSAYSSIGNAGPFQISKNPFSQKINSLGNTVPFTWTVKRPKISRFNSCYRPSFDQKNKKKRYFCSETPLLIFHRRYGITYKKNRRLAKALVILVFFRNQYEHDCL